MKTWHVVFDPQAIEDLQQIETLIAKRDTPRAAARYVERIISFCEKLTSAPARGTARDDLRLGARVLGFERRVSVVVWLHEDEIRILRIFYAGQTITLDAD